MGSVFQHNTHGPINWFSQSLTFGYWRWLNRWSFKPYLILFKSIRTSQFVNNFLKFSFRYPVNYLLRSLFNNFTTTSKNVNPKNKKPSLFLWRLILFRSWPNLSLYNITANTFTFSKCIPTINICIINSHYKHIYYQKIKNTNLFHFFTFLTISTTHPQYSHTTRNPYRP